MKENILTASEDHCSVEASVQPEPLVKNVHCQVLRVILYQEVAANFKGSPGLSSVAEIGMWVGWFAVQTVKCIAPTFVSVILQPDQQHTIRVNIKDVY